MPVWVAPLMNALLYLTVSSVLLAVFTYAYVRITPYDEIEMIHDKNTAAAASLGGAMLGFVIPLAVIIVHSHKITHMLLWSVLALAVQLLAFFVVSLVTRNFAQMMSGNNTAAGVFLGSVSLAVGILNAACLTP